MKLQVGLHALVRASGFILALWALSQAIFEAYSIRLFAIRNYGLLIHEFDPWFNYRATEYLAEKGWKAFFTWFDHMSWYPLGRPVATTIYPGMQIAAVAIWRVLEAVGRPWSLNDVCCYVPAWFGASSAVFAGLLAHEASFDLSGGSGAALVSGSAVMAVVAAHSKRSIGGGFDNESVAVTPMCAAFAFWARSFRSAGSWRWAILAGLAYGCMAASWGGYVFVLNVIGAHAGLLLLLGYDTHEVHRAYTSFYIVGTLCAMQTPMVGWAPLRSLEQLGPLAVFAAVQVAVLWKATRSSPNRRNLLYMAGAVVAIVIALLVPSGHFAPLSGRVRALFGAGATKTGNPLVDSVSEHRPSSFDAFWKHLNWSGPVALASPIVLLGGSLLNLGGRGRWPSEAALFGLVLGALSSFFSLKMARLIILMGPATSALAGVTLGAAFDVAVSPVWSMLEGPGSSDKTPRALRIFHSWPSCLARLAVAAAVVHGAVPYAKDFYQESVRSAKSFSHPRIDGQVIEGYHWLRDNTPTDARIMSWWDYGYQIAGMANRTTLADGNTWNIDHIGLIGLALSSPLDEGHRIARHLADYVLFWSNDLGKSGHFARIANSAFPGHCEERTCEQYNTRRNGSPTRMMQDSLTWNALKPGNRAPRWAGEFGELYEEVFVTSGSKVRILRILNVSKESRAFTSSPSSRLCDAPGSWYCPGQYPPLLRQLLGWDPAEPGNDEARLHRLEYEGRVERQRAEAPGPHGPGIPPGSYRDSCRGCFVRGENLVCARCSSPGRASSESSLRIALCAGSGGLVDNIHGQLECKPKPNAPNIPAGAYAGSCQGCELIDSERLLRCSHCGAANGQRKRTEIRLDNCLSPAFPDNQDGILVCVGVPNGPGIPEGPYSKSCGGCAIEGKGAEAMLQCSHCTTAAKEQVRASIRLSDCGPRQRFDNQDGRLKCA